MNYFKYTFTLLLGLFFFTACDSEEQEENDDAKQPKTEEVDVSDMRALSLAENGLDITIMLPSVSSSTGASIEPRVIHEDDGFRWEVTLGEKFVLIIEDYANEENLVSEEKKRIEGYGFFNIVYLLEEDDLIMYKRELPDGAGGNSTYHVYGMKKLNNAHIIFRSIDDGFHKPTVEDMVRTIRSASDNIEPA